MIECALDASAHIALLRNEPGAERVAPYLAVSGMGSANLSEVVALFARSGATEDSIRALLDPLPIIRVPIDEKPRLFGWHDAAVDATRWPVARGSIVPRAGQTTRGSGPHD